jgi:hypothetical protein
MRLKDYKSALSGFKPILRQNVNRIFLTFLMGLVLPGHRRLFKEHRARIDELKLHHEKRTEEILSYPTSR